MQFIFTFVLIISLFIEIEEHIEKEGILSDNEIKPIHRIIGLFDVKDNTIRPANEELQDLEHCYVALPPEVGPEGWPERSQRIVAVHKAMYSAVQHYEQPNNRYHCVVFE